MNSFNLRYSTLEFADCEVSANDGSFTKIVTVKIIAVITVINTLFVIDDFFNFIVLLSLYNNIPFNYCNILKMSKQCLFKLEFYFYFLLYTEGII